MSGRPWLAAGCAVAKATALASAITRDAGVNLRVLIGLSLISARLPTNGGATKARPIRTITAWQEDRRKQPWECGNSGAAGFPGVVARRVAMLDPARRLLTAS